MDTIITVEQFLNQSTIEWYYHNDQELKFYVDNISTQTVDPETVLSTMFSESVIDDYCAEKDLVFFQVPENKVLEMHRRPATFYGLKSGLYMCSARDYFNHVLPILDGAAKWLIEYFEQNG
jgi:hypothetical protein